MTVVYSQHQIEEWVGAGSLRKGHPYVRQVSGLKWQGNLLSAKVQGSQRAPYDVSVEFHDEGRDTWIEDRCSCPVEFECKHVAAVLLAGLQHIPQSTIATVPSVALRPVRTQERPSAIRPELVSWLEEFRASTESAAPDKKKSTAPRPTHSLVYVFSRDYSGKPTVSLHKARVSADGTVGKPEDYWDNLEAALLKPPKFVTEADLPILRGLWLCRRRDYGSGYDFTGPTGAAILEMIVASGRAFAMSDASAMHPGTPRALHHALFRACTIEWQVQPDNRVRPFMQTTPASTLLFMTDPSWYVDAVTGEAGTVQLKWPATQISRLLTMPPISPEEAVLVGTVLGQVAPTVPLPPGSDMDQIRIIASEPTPVLELKTTAVYINGWGYGPKQPLDYALLSFDYEGHRLAANSQATLVHADNSQVLQIKRHLAFELDKLNQLRKIGFKRVSASDLRGPQAVPRDALCPKEVSGWSFFVAEMLPALRKSGWCIEMSQDFSFNVTEVDQIDGKLLQAEDGWFDVEMGITVNERTVRLEPLLADLFKRDPRWLSGGLDSIGDADVIELQTDRKERLRIRADRLKPVVRTLIDLFDSIGGMRLSKWDLGRLDVLENLGRWEFRGDDSIKQLAARLMGGPGVVQAAVPVGLEAQLRPYQRQGLAWMQYLREHKLSGVLADEMGLGKTIQTLAHILSEKEQSRLDRPALIVVPTTLMHNWRQEAKRFAPGLRLLDLHGPSRHERFAEISDVDLVLTTYALLWRDQEILAKHKFHLLILDEAQYVKNAATKSATAIRELEARHRLCLTGTPLENHLGELWAQFDFLLPGFLGTQKDFSKRWRIPIEKGSDQVRAQLLARRIRPFMLRRRKADVAAELPPKTTVVRTVEIEGGQRDLYETVRAAMQEKIRAAIADKGFARSQIVVLDALLKLRQVCCDPRLLKIPQAARVKESAKLGLLLDMLGELVEEGRRILVFSQFTGMLQLIADALTDKKLPFVTLTGETTDRATPIERFCNAEVPIFLISLKAGGVGLNLTAADTVIHYDPWWNPAAENQASDRAHRIGQDKPVFVYKLITAGSIEEKIVAMQAKKAALADAILSEDGASAVKFTAEDLAALFEPIPEVTAKNA